MTMVYDSCVCVIDVIVCSNDIAVMNAENIVSVS